MKIRLKTYLSVLAVALALVACNQNNAQSATKATAATQSTPTTEQQSNSEVVAALQNNLTKSEVGIKPIAAYATAMPDIFWVNFDDAPAMFTDKTGSYLIQGQIVKLGQSDIQDVGADAIANIAKQSLSSIDSSEMIIYPAKGKKQAAVYVFTDPTCSYCQKLHKEIEQITAGGIEVRYLAWPRAERDIPLVESIWCSTDRKATLTAAKQGQTINSTTCDNPVKRHKSLGLQLGVSGTPAIFTESGRQIGGYLPASELIKAATSN